MLLLSIGECRQTVSSSRCFRIRVGHTESVPQPLLGLRGETVVLRRTDHLQLADGARLREPRLRSPVERMGSLVLRKLER